ncbi:MAG: manganese efflux pump [Bacteroidales bacterium]|nr:manganese efflux pump [Bacteroidales bacterium]
MDLFSLVIIAIGLSFDSFAVSVSSGIIKSRITFNNAIKIASFLAFFQAAMPVIGWFLGSEIETYAAEFDHWIAFGLLALLGGKMIISSFRDSSMSKPIDPLKLPVLFSLSVATSIDALIVGFSFGFLEINIILAVLVIGGITFFVSMLGILFGKKTGSGFGKKMEILGGIILISIGIKILVEHLMIH